MKKFIAFLLLFTLVFICVACGDDYGQGGGVVKPTAVTITNAKTQYVMGEAVKLEAAIEPANATVKTVEWATSDDKVVTVDTNGTLTFKGVGEATITVNCKADASVKAEAAIKVVRPELTGIEISLADSVVEGFTTNATITVTPQFADGSVTWSSSDESVATVNENGVVTGVSIGKAIISATSKANSNITASKEVEVKVEDGSLVIPESIKISSSEIMKVGYNVTIKAIVSPSNAYQGVVWKSLDEDVLKVDAYGVATGIKEGVARLMCVSKASSNIKSNIIEIKVYEDDSRESVDLKGYKIEIMQASSALGEIDPFLYSYIKPDKLYKQEVWESVEKEYNCDLSVKPYPDMSPWATSKINYIIDNANNNVATADLFVVSSTWLEEFVENNSAVDVTEYFERYTYGKEDALELITSSYKGRVYGLNTGVSKTKTYVDLGLFYNIAWTEKLGVEDPAQMYLDGKWNYSEFKNWCLTVQSLLNSENGEYAIGGHSYYYWSGMTNTTGVKVYDRESVSIEIDSDRSQNAASFINELVNENVFDVNESWAEKDGGFIEGKTVMTTGKLWFINNKSRWANNMFGDDTRIGYVPFPYPDDMNREEAKMGCTDLTVYMYGSGRSNYYPEGVTIKEIYRAVNAMCIGTIDKVNSDPSYNSEELLYNELKTKLGNDASIKCVMLFDDTKFVYDPISNMLKKDQYDALKDFTSNVIINGNNYNDEYEKLLEIIKGDLE